MNDLFEDDGWEQTTQICQAHYQHVVYGTEPTRPEHAGAPWPRPNPHEAEEQRAFDHAAGVSGV